MHQVRAASPVGGAAAAGGADWASRLLGPQLLTSAGPRATGDVLRGKVHVCLYFSAAWCGWCTQFTTLLIQRWREAGDGEWAVVFVSFDNDQASFDRYRMQMPFPAVPFSHAVSLKHNLGSQFEVYTKGLPLLVRYAGATGSVRDKEARRAVEAAASGPALLQQWAHG